MTPEQSPATAETTPEKISWEQLEADIQTLDQLTNPDLAPLSFVHGDQTCHLQIYLDMDQQVQFIVNDDTFNQKAFYKKYQSVTEFSPVAEVAPPAIPEPEAVEEILLKNPIKNEALWEWLSASKDRIFEEKKPLKFYFLQAGQVYSLQIITRRDRKTGQLILMGRTYLQGSREMFDSEAFREKYNNPALLLQASQTNIRVTHAIKDPESVKNQTASFKHAGTQYQVHIVLYPKKEELSWRVSQDFTQSRISPIRKRLTGTDFYDPAGHIESNPVNKTEKIRTVSNRQFWEWIQKNERHILYRPQESFIFEVKDGDKTYHLELFTKQSASSPKGKVMARSFLKTPEQLIDQDTFSQQFGDPELTFLSKFSLPVGKADSLKERSRQSREDALLAIGTFTHNDTPHGFLVKNDHNKDLAWLIQPEQRQGPLYSLQERFKKPVFIDPNNFTRSSLQDQPRQR